MSSLKKESTNFSNILIFSMVLWVAALTNSCHKSESFEAIPVGLLPEKSLVDTSFNRLFDQQIKENIELHQCPGVAILVMKGNQVIFEKQYGTKSKYSPDTIDASTIFRIGSVSKGFSGILASILIDKNIIHLDDPISMYIPEVTIRARSKDKILRLKHILSHSSGLTEHAYSNLVDENRDMETIISYLNKLTPRDSTGKAYAYQNATFGLIEKVIEEATGMTYSKALDFYIFSPLKMCNTSCTFDEIRSSENACYGHKYSGQRHGFVPIDFSPHYYNVVSAGGINAPLSDMKKWLNAVMGYRPDVISPNARKIAFTPYISTSDDDKYFNMWPGIKDSHYGLGWRLIRTQNHDLVYHGGMVNGFRTEIAFDREKDLGIVILFNSVCRYSNQAVHMFYDLWDTYHQDKVEDYL
ncbi:MAG: beta-lactamase family protein [Saprospiraceae bacterium]|nr:beta-lactamase family protein [Saprospiraceae bacterium]